MRPLSTSRLLLTCFFLCLAVASLFVLNKRLYASYTSGKDACYQEGDRMSSELPWEHMTYQFMSSLLFK